MRHSSLLWLSALITSLTFLNCQCKESGLKPTDGGSTACQSHEECQKALGARYVCRDGVCCPGPRYCETSGEAECCPGQTCNRTQVCVDRYDACSEDLDCSVKGQRCLEHATGVAGPAECGGEVQTTTVCTFERCGSDGSCTEGLSCFNGFCVGENPCGGSCPSGQVCSVSNNRCQDAPDVASCAVTCDPGLLLTFSDPDNIDDGCSLDTVECTCVPLPPLSARDIGRHSALGLLSDGTALVSAFEGDHGDLVVVTFDASGRRVDTTWVDGLPTGGTPVADPNGPRGGIADPGPEVGRYTDIAVAPDDTVHVSYYDVSDGGLRYARRSAGTWSVHTVDTAGDVGRYTSIALDGAGVPVIAYFQAAGENDPNESALKVARATSPAPASAADWQIVTVESASVPPPPCNAACATGERCVDLGAGAVCQAERSDCATACGSGSVCVDDGTGTPVCSPELKPSALDNLPEGTGLFPALFVTSSGSITVAYHDRLTGALKIAVGVDPASGTPGTVTAVEGSTTDRVGLFPSIALDGSGDYIVVHRDESTQRVLWTRISSAGARLDGGVVDDGLRDPAGNGVSFVGADTALVIDGDRWFIVYHDGTGGDLVLSTRAADGTFTRQELVTEGSAGFWADAALQGGQLRVSHATLRGARSGPMFTDLSVVTVTP